MCDETSGAKSDFYRARQILRNSRELTVEQFHELDSALRGVNQVQFHALVEDPCHAAVLRHYEAFSWRQGSRGTIAILLAIFVAMSAALLIYMA